MEPINGNGSFFWVEERNGQKPIPMKHKRKAKPKTEFVGWGSKSLIEFLNSIGKDTGEQLSERDVTAIIIEYVHTSNLFHPIKKKKVVCDDRLRSLFGKRSLPRIKIQDLLKSHFADNHDSSEDDDYLYSSEEYEDTNVTSKKHKVSDSEKIVKQKAPATPMSCFAAIIPENIKLMYLKRSLVQELVKHPESFKAKLLGSYIRIKSDPNDFSQKNSHQILPVTGVKNVPGNGDVCEEVLLQVPNMMDIRLSMLSDADFSKEECEDLCEKVKGGLIKRPTVVEVEQKAQLLHEDITKHWLPRELAYLQNLIDRANEKGWRKELFEYIERRKLLQTPSEQSKLLTEVPKVTADPLEPEATPQEDEQDIQHLNSSDPAEEEGVTIVGANEERMEEGTVVNCGENEGNNALKLLDNVAEVIELSDDEEKTDEKAEEEEEYSVEKWFYFDPQEQIQGPVSRINLARWSEAGYFSPDFKVWEDGQLPDTAVLLTSMLSGS